MKAIARWESRSGKYWLELYAYTDGSFGYRGVGCGGYGYTSVVSLLDELQRRIDRGEFQPDANKTPMKRVI